MDQISEHINSSNHKIHSYDKMSKMIVNLGSKKCENNENSLPHLTLLQNLLLMRIVDTPEKGFLNVVSKFDMRKVRKYSVNSSSTLFSCSMPAMYNRVNGAQK